MAPFYADTGTGNMYYRYYDVLSSPEGLDRDEVKEVELFVKRIENVKGFKAKFIMFATWENVTPFQPTLNKSTV